MFLKHSFQSLSKPLMNMKYFKGLEPGFSIFFQSLKQSLLKAFEGS